MKKGDLPQVAILEDNLDLLNHLKELLEDNKLAEVVIYSQDASEFIQKVKKTKSDSLILLLDIELDNPSSTGVDVATILKLPTVFVSGRTKDYLSGIETINLESNFLVDFVLKPITKEKITRILTKTLDQIKAIEKSKRKLITFNFDDIKKQKDQNTIVFLESLSDGTNNKRVYFTDEKPTTIPKFTFAKMPEKGFDVKNLFLMPHQSYRVNIKHIDKYDTKEHKLIVTYQDENGEKATKKIPISENYRSNIKKRLQ